MEAAAVRKGERREGGIKGRLKLIKEQGVSPKGERAQANSHSPSPKAERIPPEFLNVPNESWLT